MDFRTIPKKRILMAVTGASGALYASRLLDALLAREEVELVGVVFSTTAKLVVTHELQSRYPDCSLLQVLTKKHRHNSELKRVIRFDVADFYAPCASGSNAFDAMVIVPCSMGTVGRVASGLSSSLIERSADVALKERRMLVVCPRESPFNLIHLKNLTSLAEAGAMILPLMPGFYNEPSTVEDLADFCVERIVSALGFLNAVRRPWMEDRVQEINS